MSQKDLSQKPRQLFAMVQQSLRTQCLSTCAPMCVSLIFPLFVAVVNRFACAPMEAAVASASASQNLTSRKKEANKVMTNQQPYCTKYVRLDRYQSFVMTLLNPYVHPHHYCRGRCGCSPSCAFASNQSTVFFLLFFWLKNPSYAGARIGAQILADKAFPDPSNPLTKHKIFSNGGAGDNVRLPPKVKQKVAH